MLSVIQTRLPSFDVVMISQIFPHHWVLNLACLARQASTIRHGRNLRRQSRLARRNARMHQGRNVSFRQLRTCLPGWLRQLCAKSRHWAPIWVSANGILCDVDHTTMSLALVVRRQCLLLWFGKLSAESIRKPSGPGYEDLFVAYSLENTGRAPPAILDSWRDE